MEGVWCVISYRSTHITILPCFMSSIYTETHKNNSKVSRVLICGIMTDIQSYSKGFISVAETKWMGWVWGLNKKEKHPLMKAAILPLSKWGNGSVRYWTQCGWNTAAHCCISALYGNPDKSKRSSCHWYDVVRKHRNGLCYWVYVCVHKGWIAVCHWDQQPWTGKDRSTAGAAVQLFTECWSQVLFLSNPYCSSYLKPGVPPINTHINLNKKTVGGGVPLLLFSGPPPL